MMFESLYCFNKPSDLYFFGDINLDIVSGLQISFEECDDSKHSCYSKDSRAKFFSEAAGNFLLMTLTN
jgi:hypothetical protein